MHVLLLLSSSYLILTLSLSFFFLPPYCSRMHGLVQPQPRKRVDPPARFTYSPQGICILHDKYVVSRTVLWCVVVLCAVMSWYVILCYVMLCHVMSRHVLQVVMLCRAINLILNPLYFTLRLHTTLLNPLLSSSIPFNPLLFNSI